MFGIGALDSAMGVLLPLCHEILEKLSWSMTAIVGRNRASEDTRSDSNLVPVQLTAYCGMGDKGLM